MQTGFKSKCQIVFQNKEKDQYLSVSQETTFDDTGEEHESQYLTVNNGNDEPGDGAGEEHESQYLTVNNGGPDGSQTTQGTDGEQEYLTITGDTPSSTGGAGEEDDFEC